MNSQIEDLIDELRKKGYSFPERKETIYWRRLRNSILHENEKIEDVDAKQANLFFKEIYKQIENLDLLKIQILTENEVQSLKSKLDKLSVN
ncbi:MAG: hypothetical protein ACTSPY_05875 [Candidatus Helarchaeota archaeon]